MRSQLSPANNTPKLSKNMARKTLLDAHRETRGRLDALRHAARRGRAQKRHCAFGLDGAVQAIERRVRSLSPDDLLERYHELIDRRFAGPLSLAESFELDRVEAHLDLGDQKEAECITGVQRQWGREQDDLVRSIEELLARLKVSPLKAAS